MTLPSNYLYTVTALATLEATHSLVGNEAPHAHFWDFEVSLTGKPYWDGRVLDLVLLEKALHTWLRPLQKSYLNTNASLPAYAQQSPSCESLGAHLMDCLTRELLPDFQTKNPSLKLKEILVTLRDDSGAHTWGRAKIQNTP